VDGLRMINGPEESSEINQNWMRLSNWSLTHTVNGKSWRYFAILKSKRGDENFIPAKGFFPERVYFLSFWRLTWKALVG